MLCLRPDTIDQAYTMGRHTDMAIEYQEAEDGMWCPVTGSAYDTEGPAEPLRLPDCQCTMCREKVEELVREKRVTRQVPLCPMCGVPCSELRTADGCEKRGDLIQELHLNPPSPSRYIQQL